MATALAHGGCLELLTHLGAACQLLTKTAKCMKRTNPNGVLSGGGAATKSSGTGPNEIPNVKATCTMEAEARALISAAYESPEKWPKVYSKKGWPSPWIAEIWIHPIYSH